MLIGLSVTNATSGANSISCSTDTFRHGGLKLAMSPDSRSRPLFPDGVRLPFRW